MPAQPGQSSDNATCSPEIIQVEPNKTYRLRAISGVAMSAIVFAFEEHDNLTIIAADARYTKQADTDIIQMGPGQRYDFLLHTKSEEELQALGKTEFWMQIETRYRSTNDTFYAILSYTSGNTTAESASPPAEAPVYIPYSIEGWFDYTLEPLIPDDFPSADQVTRQVVLVASQLIAKTGEYWTVNNRTWTEYNQHEGDTPYYNNNLTHDTPYLVNVFTQGERAIPDYENAVQNHGGWDPELDVYAAKIGEVIDIILINEPNGKTGGFDTHPWHSHGAHYWDLGSGQGKYNATANEEKLKGYHPIKRDTSLLFKYTAGDDIGAGLDYSSQGWRVWRVRVSDPG